MKVAAQAYAFSPADIEKVTEQFRLLLSACEFLTLDAYVARFEQEFAQQHRDPLATATLDAIASAVKVAGSKLTEPAHTLAATCFAILRASARPVFTDFGTDLTLEPADIARRITGHARSIVAAHIGRLISPATPELAPLRQDRGIADAAHGSSLDGLTGSSFCLVATFSYFCTEVIIPMGKGGLILTADQRQHDTVRLIRDQGKGGGGNHPEVIDANCRLTEVQAMLRLLQVYRRPQFVARRQALPDGPGRCARPAGPAGTARRPIQRRLPRRPARHHRIGTAEGRAAQPGRHRARRAYLRGPAASAVSLSVPGHRPVAGRRGSARAAHLPADLPFTDLPRPLLRNLA